MEHSLKQREGTILRLGTPIRVEAQIRSVHGIRIRQFTMVSWRKGGLLNVVTWSRVLRKGVRDEVPGEKGVISPGGLQGRARVGGTSTCRRHNGRVRPRDHVDHVVTCVSNKDHLAKVTWLRVTCLHNYPFGGLGWAGFGCWSFDLLQCWVAAVKAL